MNFKKIQKLDSSYFRGKNYFAGDNGIQNYLVFQPMSKYFKTHAVPKHTSSGLVVFIHISEWKSK